MKKTLSLWTLILALVFSFVPVMQMNIAAADATVELIEQSGAFETAYAKWSYDGTEMFNVYYRAADGTGFTKIDDELVRKYPDYYRADVLGLAAGDYVLKIVPVENGTELTDKAVETEVLSVANYTREGFAFSKNSPQGTSNGAYNADGTLRSDADVLYITNGNKDTVTINGDASMGVGLHDILAYREAKKIKTALSVRLIGCVEEPMYVDTHTVRFINTGNVTLEGVGDDATIYGWIMTLKRVENFEIRNLGMMYGGEGATASAIVLDTDNKNVWIHNCDFFYGAPGKDADQIKGDGAIDLKSRSDYVTVSYNHYWDCGKTCVSGGPWEVSNVDDERAKVFVTYHHNWFDHSDSRHPRCVAGSNHVYNNYYDGVAMYGIGAAVKTSVFSENNYYRNCQRPMIIASQGSDCWDEATQTYKTKGTLSGQVGGMIKSYGDVIIGAKRFYDQNTTPHEGHIDAYTATSRDEQVPDTIKAYSGGATYNNFDTNPDIMYEYNVDTPEVAVEKIKAYAGRLNGGDFKWEFDNATQDPNHDVIPELLAALKSYESELVAVAGGAVAVEPPVIEVTPSPTPDPNVTAKPSVTPVPGGDGLLRMPVGAKSYAKDWFNGANMSAGDVSADGYVGCYKGNGNSYKTNNFTYEGLSLTRGYQTKQLSARSFYLHPEAECMITIYFYSAARTLALYTTDANNPVATFLPEAGGDYAYTYHYTDVNSPLYIAGPDGDIYIAGIEIAAVAGQETAPPADDPTPSPSTDPTTPPADDPTPSPSTDPTTPPADDPTPSPSTDPTTPPTDEPEKEMLEINEFTVENGTVTYTYSADEALADADVYVAVYDNDGRLVYCSKNMTTASFTCDGAYKIKVMAWKGLELLCDAVEAYIK